MAKRGPSHNFVKQEKERKRLKKAAQKAERRNLKKQPSAVDINAEGDQSNVDPEVDTTNAETKV